MIVFLNLNGILGWVPWLEVLVILIVLSYILLLLLQIGGGKVARTKEAIKDFILKRFVKRSNTIKVNSVENTVHTITKILLSHLGNKGFDGILLSVSFLMGILFPFLSFFP